MATILVTHPLPGDAVDRLIPDHRVEVIPAESRVDTAILMEKVEPLDALIVLLSHAVDGALLRKAKRLKIVANYAVGFNNIDVEEATRQGVWVTNTPDVLTDATADLTWALILAASRRVVEGDRMVREGRFHGWKPDLLLGTGLVGKTLGVVGMGRIGRAVACRAVGFGMKVVYHDPALPDLSSALPFEATGMSLEELLPGSHILTLHLPLTEETRHFIDRNALALLPDGAIVINTSRGPVMDESALVEALKEGKVGSAGLDVYEEEPRGHPDLLSMPHVVLLPHLGSATLETRSAMAHLAVDNVLKVLNGEAPLTPVNNPKHK